MIVWSNVILSQMVTIDGLVSLEDETYNYYFWEVI